ncbi:hypothetical protein CEXT_481501 [Caerostris extrusa]|uniref:Transposase n=1 Tax=Caerostris extrusa TaxID=172846 RepID=A0AAV4Y8T5_CAEEX|nr:hypothetical protein CEXT_481501 [Caerostris extrusa]
MHQYCVVIVDGSFIVGPLFVEEVGPAGLITYTINGKRCESLFCDQVKSFQHFNNMHVDKIICMQDGAPPHIAKNYGCYLKNLSPPLMKEDHMISYSDFRKVAEKSDNKFKSYFSSKIYSKLLQNDMHGRISIQHFFNYGMRKVWLHQTRIGLSFYDLIGQGYLREIELENYILELIPTLPQLRDETLPKNAQETNWFSAPSALRVWTISKSRY